MVYLYNVLIITIVALPLLILEILDGKVKWISTHKESIGFILWLIAITYITFILVPYFGLKPNERFFNY